MILRFCAAVLFGGASIVPGIAGSDVKAKEIVDFFVRSGEPGTSRGLCIGSAEECDTRTDKPAGFDMLINFEPGSAALTPLAEETLNEFAKALGDQQLAAVRFVIEGHTDASGAETYNDDLSERRARSVADFLFRNGVASDKVVAVGRGEKDPRVPDAFDAINRRVEMRVRLE